MSCEPEKVTGYVDGELGPGERAQLEAHLQACPDCLKQVAEERALRERLRGLRSPEPRPELDERVRAGVAPRRWTPLRALLPLAAVLALAFLWGRGLAPVVAVQLARDHRHCFDRPKLPAQVWSAQMPVVAGYFAERGTSLPPLPASAGGLELVGARYCRLFDRRIAHLYYSGENGRLSVFVVPEPVRLTQAYAFEAFGESVRLRRVAGQTVGLVAEDTASLLAFERSFEQSVAQARPPGEPAGLDRASARLRGFDRPHAAW